jgi:HTH-type transcriptional regulator / antitoxin HipB
MARPLAEILRSRRKARGLSQAQVASHLGMQRPSLTQLESGRRSTNVETAQEWARAVGAELAVVDKEVAALLDQVDQSWLATILAAVPLMTRRERATWLAEARLVLDEAAEEPSE